MVAGGCKELGRTRGGGGWDDDGASDGPGGMVNDR